MGRFVLVMWPKEFLSLLWVLVTSPVRWDDNQAGEEEVREHLHQGLPHPTCFIIAHSFPSLPGAHRCNSPLNTNAIGKWRIKNIVQENKSMMVTSYNCLL